MKNKVAVVRRDDIAFGLISSKNPKYLTKVFKFKDDKLSKESFATVVDGWVDVRSVANLQELHMVLNELEVNQAVTWGVPALPARIVTSRRLTRNPDAVARSRDFFSFRKAAGILMIDHDGAPDASCDPDALRQRLLEICPSLQSTPMLCRPSASSGICAPDGRALTSTNKHRLYIPVKDASLIPTAGKNLVTLLWAHGYGWVEVGTAGQPLEKTLIDGSVFQSERLDFAAGPVLFDGLTRTADAGRILGAGDQMFDLSEIRMDPATEAAATKHKRLARQAMSASCETRRQEWATANASQLASNRNISVDEAHALLVRASAHQVLTGDFILRSEENELVSVDEILSEPRKWHRSRFADPLGDYPEDRRIATAFLLSGSRPTLHSFGHGRQIFELRRQAARILIGKGRRVEATDNTLKVLQESGELFDFGESSIAYVGDGRARTATADWLVDHMGRTADFFTRRTFSRGGQTMTEDRPDDAPAAIAHIIMAKNGQRGFRKLKGVVTAPTLRADGSILDIPGYDAASELFYFNSQDVALSVPASPTPDESLAALRFIWTAFAKFPFVDDISRGVVLQAIITACLRASLPTAPGIAFDAPSAGTGKTLLARAIGAIAVGTDVSTFAPVSKDDEMRKRLFASLRDGARVVLLDNLREPLGGSAIDSFLTSPIFSDRVLGESTTSALPNRAILLVTGNNLRLSGDTLRRVLVARLDAETERVYTREFDFDPVELITAERQQYVVSALTIVRGWITAGRPRDQSPGKLASFEVWDELVRKPLCWLRGLVALKSEDEKFCRFDDPIRAIGNAVEHDPEKARLLALLTISFDKFGSTPVTTSRIIERATDTRDDLMEVIDEIAGDRGVINRWRLGRWIEGHVGQILDGKRFARVGDANGVALWAVETVDDASKTKPWKPETPNRL